MKWFTDEEAERIRELWTVGGYSAAQIAQIIGNGRTRNSIIGFAHRRLRGERPLGEPGRLKINLKVKPEAFKRDEKTARKPLPTPPQEPLLLCLEDMKPRQCRFACTEGDGGYLFCGHPTGEGSSWCAHHRAIVYVPAIPKSKRKRANILAVAGL